MAQRKKPLIMNVDDNPDILAMTEFILRDSGYNIVTATSGREALQMLSNISPDLILLDGSMPDMDGCELCSALKASQATAAVPIVFLSGSDDTEQRKAALAAGAVDYLVKPALPPLLLGTIKTCLKKKRGVGGVGG